ncbi:MAG: glycosyltransferase, partial [Desulfobaccales bacterium]
LALFNYFWSIIKAKNREKRIKKEQVFYERLAHQRKIIILDKEQVKLELQYRLQQRGIKPFHRVLGQLRTIYASEMSNWEPHQIPPALGKFGPNVVYSLKEHGFLTGKDGWLAQRDNFDKDLLSFVKAEHKKQPVDVFISYLSGWHVAPETIRAITHMGIITCAFHWDDRLSFRGRQAGGRWSGPASLAAAYDLNLTNAPASLIKYFAEGGLAIFWPEGANPDHFRPLLRPFEFDVTFVGACYGQRPDYIKYLRKNGVKIEAFGPGWPRGSVTEQEMVEIYARSRINLGFSGIGYSMKEMCLKGRDFEVPMCGHLYLTSDQPDLYRVYEVGKEIITYRSKVDCLSKIRYFLEQPEEGALIRQRVRERCLRDHTWEHRFADLFKLLGVLHD